MIGIEFDDGVAIVEVKSGKTNALNLELMTELQGALKVIGENPGAGGVVLASGCEKFFSIGFDIPRLFKLDREDFRLFYRSFNQACLELYTLPKPTIAAVNGHAVAGGCILALCCDYRFIGSGHKLMGLNEVKLGVPVPLLADRIVRSLTGAAIARDIMELGEFYPPDKMARYGLVDQVLPAEEVFDRAVARARELGVLPAHAYAAIKQHRVEAIVDQVKKGALEKEELFLDCWYRHDVRRILKEAMEKF